VSDDFLQGDDVGIDLVEHLHDACRADAPVEAATLVDIVGGYTQPEGVTTHFRRSLSGRG
jgi:hypothetical protein